MEVYITCLEDLDFADDIVLIRSIKGAHNWFGDNHDKNNENKEPLLLDGEPIEDVDEFRYFGKIFSKEAPNKILKLETRSKKAKAAFIQLRPLWNPRKLVERPKSKFTEAYKNCSIIWL